MRVVKSVAALVVVLGLGLMAARSIAQEVQADGDEPVLSAMLTDLAQSDARGHNPKLRAVSTMLQAARRLDESNSKASLLLAESLQALGDGMAAVEVLDAYIAMEPENEVALANALFLYLQTLQTSEHRQSYLAGLAGRPELPAGVKGVVLQELARLSFEAAQEDTGWAIVSQAIKVDAYNLGARQQMLEFVETKDNIVSRLMLLAQMVRINPLRSQMVWKFANALDDVGLHLEAQKWYKYAWGVHTAGAQGEEISDDELLDLGASYVLSQDYDVAMLVLNRVLERNPNRVDIRIWLARAATGIGEEERAESQLAVAEKLLLARAQDNPSDPTAVNQVAWFYLQDKPDKNKAMVWSKKAIDLDPENIQAQLCMGLALLAEGQIDPARTQLEPLAATNAWARLGMVRVVLSGEHTEEELAQAIQATFSRHSGGWVGLAMRELARTQGLDIDMNAYLEPLRRGIAAELGNAAELRDFYRHPQDYLFLKMEPSKTEYDSYEPLMMHISLTTNMNSSTIVMGPGMMLNPRMLFSVRLSGGLQRELKYYDFVSLYKKRRMDPGQGLSDTVRLDRGELRTLLRHCPQETVTIKMSCILDPQVIGQDEYLPALGGQVSKEVVLVRYGFRPNPEAMARVYRLLKDGPMRSKIRSTMLLGDLLANSRNPQAIPDAKRPRAVDEKRISAALVEASRQGNWRARAWFGEGLRLVRLDSPLSEALADQIRDPHWFVRLMAVRAAGIRGQSWNEILRRVAQTDKDQLVRQMAGSYVNNGPAPEAE